MNQEEILRMLEYSDHIPVLQAILHEIFGRNNAVVTAV